MEKVTNYEWWDNLNCSDQQFALAEMNKCREALYGENSRRARMAENRFGPNWRKTVQARLDYLEKNGYESFVSKLPGEDYVPKELKKEYKNDRFGLICALSYLW